MVCTSFVTTHAHMFMACLGRKGLSFFEARCLPSLAISSFISSILFLSVWTIPQHGDCRVRCLLSLLLAVKALGRWETPWSRFAASICIWATLDFIGSNQVSALSNQVVIACKIYLVCGRNRDEPSMEYKQPAETASPPTDCRYQMDQIFRFL